MHPQKACPPPGGGTHEEEVYYHVGPAEANLTAGKISLESPLGQALLGKQVGAAVKVDAPGGEITFKVKSIE